MITKLFSHVVRIRSWLSKWFSIEKVENVLNSTVRGWDVSKLLVYGLIVLYTVVFSYFTILKYNAFKAYAWDLGIFNQSLWTTVRHGKFFYSTLESFIVPSGVYFGTHFSPILFLLLPVYAIGPMPETFLIFQSFVLALGALPLYLLVRDRLNNKFAGIIFVIAYLLYPPLHSANWFDFHLQSFLPVFFLFAIYYLASDKWLRYFVFIFLALTVAENVSIVVAFVGLYCIWRFRKPLLLAINQRNLSDRRVFIPLITIGMSVSWFLLVRWIQGTFFPINPAFLRIYKAVDNWSVLGVNDDPIKLPLHVILNTPKAIEALAYDGYLKLLYIVLLFGPLQFLPLRSSVSLIALCWLGPALLSNYTPYYFLGGHFPTYVIPFIFAATVFAIEKKTRRLHCPNFKRYLKNMLILGLLFAIFVSPLSPLLLTAEVQLPYFSDYYVPSIGEHEILLKRIADMVPSNASILTENHIFPHVSSRIDAYAYPLPIMLRRSPDIEMQNYIEELFRKSDYVMADRKFDPYIGGLILNNIEKNEEFGLYAYADEIYLFRRGYIDAPVVVDV